jgi:hypothetical protein
MAWTIGLPLAAFVEFEFPWTANQSIHRFHR